MEFKDKAQVRLALWLGLEEDQQNWSECCSSGDLTVLAETVSYVTSVHPIPCTCAILHIHIIFIV